MKGLFIIKIGVDEDGNYGSETLSMTDGKVNRASSKRLPQLFKSLTKRLLARAAHDRKFPPAPVSAIIVPGSVRDNTARLIVPARN